MVRSGPSRRRLVSEINVVPYIYVMLVLLIIFMVTSPLLKHGVDVDLPTAPANPLDGPIQVRIRARYRWRERHDGFDNDRGVIDDQTKAIDKFFRILMGDKPAVQLRPRARWNHINLTAPFQSRDGNSIAN